MSNGTPATPSGTPSPSAPPNTGQPASQHPFIQGLLMELPPLGSHFDEEERHSWLRAAASMFDLMYHVEDTVSVGADPQTATVPPPAPVPAPAPAPSPPAPTDATAPAAAPAAAAPAAS